LNLIPLNSHSSPSLSSGGDCRAEEAAASGDDDGRWPTSGCSSPTVTSGARQDRSVPVRRKQIWAEV
ncbi:hypothetical protein Dimus_020759, partial [Dionaea muscipula]